MNVLRTLIACGTAAASIALIAPSYAAQSSTMQTLAEAQEIVVNPPAGMLKGVVEGNLNVFKGVPYALPPVGSRRWTPPSAMPRWTGVKEATAFGPACYQPKAKLATVYSEAPMPMSEDCLTLNIWAPANAHNAPVFFWIYGGALWNGANREALYNGARMAEHGVIVVAINYRLGVLGWLAHPGLSAESPLHISGNYGLLDQIQALHWVRNNISTFGGDPANVTIAGESAGGLSVMYLMASPYAHGLFAKAIAESAYMISTPELKVSKYGAPSAEDSGMALAASLHASNIAALRAMDPGELTNAAAMDHFGPWGAIDGHVLPHQLVTVFDKGEEAHVPILAGFNQGEIRSLMVLAPPVPASAAKYESVIHAQYGDLADAFLRLYPATDMKESVLETTRDALYGWTAERLVRKQTAVGQPSYLYMFDHGYPAMENADLHAFHASELPYVFSGFDATPPLWPKIPATPHEMALSDAMIGYWTSFARTGKPMAENAPDWPAWDAASSYMHFTETPQPSKHLLPGMYKLNEDVMCRRRAAGDLPWGWNVGVVSPKLPPQMKQCE